LEKDCKKVLHVNIRHRLMRGRSPPPCTPRALFLVQRRRRDGGLKKVLKNLFFFNTRPLVNQSHFEKEVAKLCKQFFSDLLPHQFSADVRGTLLHPELGSKSISKFTNIVLFSFVSSVLFASLPCCVCRAVCAAPSPAQLS
jgi:hypothetical protein